MEAFIFQKINGLAFRSFWADGLGVFLAEILPFIVAIFLFLLLYWNFKKYWSLVLSALMAGGLSRGITELIRIFIPRSRPFVANNVHLLIEHLKSSAFPSAHTSFFFAISVVAYYFNKKLGLLLFAASFLIAGGRIYCGVHWPLDIIAGIIVGFVSGIIVIQIFKKLSKK